MTFDEGRNLAVAASAQQVTFPMTWYRSVGCLGRQLADRYRVRDLAALLLVHRDSVRTTHAASGPQMLDKLIFKHIARLYE